VLYYFAVICFFSLSTFQHLLGPVTPRFLAFIFHFFTVYCNNFLFFQKDAKGFYPPTDADYVATWKVGWKSFYNIIVLPVDQHEILLWIVINHSGFVIEPLNSSKVMRSLRVKIFLNNFNLIDQLLNNLLHMWSCMK